MLSIGDGAAIGGFLVMASALLAKILPKKNGVTKADMEKKQDKEMCNVLTAQLGNQLVRVEKSQNKLWDKLDQIHIELRAMNGKK